VSGRSRALETAAGRTVKRGADPADDLAFQLDDLRAVAAGCIPLDEVLVDEPRADADKQHSHKERGKLEDLLRRRGWRLYERHRWTVVEQRRIFIGSARASVRDAKRVPNGGVPPPVKVNLEEENDIAEGVLEGP
jgi:hypothetical protein